MGRITMKLPFGLTKRKSAGLALIAVALLLVGVLTLIKEDTDKKNVFLCQIVSASPDPDMAKCPAHTSNTSWLLIVGFALSAIVLAMGLVLLAPASSPNIPPSLPKADLSKLDDEEKRIYEAIRLKEGSMYQSDLITETGFTKVRVTRLLDRLEQKGLVERRRRGMTNLVVLK